MGSGDDNAPPPAYGDVAPPGTDRPAEDLSAFFSQLRLDSTPKGPDPDTCLAHLKLLFAIETLKEDVGYTDGLWALWNSRADGHMIAADENAVFEVPAGKADAEDSEKHQEFLSKLREKRWALFVARAVDRYEAWWRCLSDSPPLREEDRNTEHYPTFDDFPRAISEQFWTAEILPPLGKSRPHHHEALY